MQCRACWLHGGRFLSDVPVSLYVCLPLCVCVCVLLFSLLSLLTLFGWCWFIGRPSRGSVSARTVKHITKPKEKKKKKQQNYGTEWKTEKQNSEEIKKERDRTRGKERRCDSPLLSLLSGRAQRIALDGQLLFCLPRVSTELFFFSLSLFLVLYSLF